MGVCATDPEALRRGVKTLVDDRALAFQRGKAAREFALSCYGLAPFLLRWADVLHGVIDKHRGSRR